MLYFFPTLLSLQLYISFGLAEPGNDTKASLTLEILLSNDFQDVQAEIRKGHSWIPLQCGDGQQFEFDGEEDGILTCQYKGPVGDTERLQIVSSKSPTPLFTGLLSIPKTKDARLAFQIKRLGSQWVCKRIALHRNHFVQDLMVTSREWIIAVWSILILNLIGWMLWISKRTR